VTEVLLLATEATAESSGNDPATIVVMVLLAALAAFAVAFVLVGPGKGGDRPAAPRRDIPLAMRPYHSDAELETRGLERAMSWGVALAMFSGIFLAAYWIIEPDRIDNRTDDLYARDTAFGRAEFNNACSSCHGVNAEGGAAPNPDSTITAPWPAPRLNNIVARYEGSPTVTDVRQFITQTVMQGRAGTPMPAWSSGFNGPMNDDQIGAIVEYILSIQEPDVDAPQAFSDLTGVELFQNNCARCHGPAAEGYVGPRLTDVFSRYGANVNDEDSITAAMRAIKSTVLKGRNLPTGAPMPAWAGVLTEDAIDRLVDYLLAIQNPSLR